MNHTNDNDALNETVEYGSVQNSNLKNTQQNVAYIAGSGQDSSLDHMIQKTFTHINASTTILSRAMPMPQVVNNVQGSSGSSNSSNRESVMQNLPSIDIIGDAFGGLEAATFMGGTEEDEFGDFDDAPAADPQHLNDPGMVQNPALVRQQHEQLSIHPQQPQHGQVENYEPVIMHPRELLTPHDSASMMMLENNNGSGISSSFQNAPKHISMAVSPYTQSYSTQPSLPPQQVTTKAPHQQEQSPMYLPQQVQQQQQHFPHQNDGGLIAGSSNSQQRQEFEQKQTYLAPQEQHLQSFTDQQQQEHPMYFSQQPAKLNHDETQINILPTASPTMSVFTACNDNRTKGESFDEFATPQQEDLGQQHIRTLAAGTRQMHAGIHVGDELDGFHAHASTNSPAMSQISTTHIADPDISTRSSSSVVAPIPEVYLVVEAPMADALNTLPPVATSESQVVTAISPNITGNAVELSPSVLTNNNSNSGNLISEAFAGLDIVPMNEEEDFGGFEDAVVSSEDDFGGFEDAVVANEDDFGGFKDVVVANEDDFVSGSTVVAPVEPTHGTKSSKLTNLALPNDENSDFDQICSNDTTALPDLSIHDNVGSTEFAMNTSNASNLDTTNALSIKEQHDRGKGELGFVMDLHDSDALPITNLESSSTITSNALSYVGSSNKIEAGDYNNTDFGRFATATSESALTTPLSCNDHDDDESHIILSGNAMHGITQDNADCHLNSDNASFAKEQYTVTTRNDAFYSSNKANLISETFASIDNVSNAEGEGDEGFGGFATVPTEAILKALPSNDADDAHDDKIGNFGQTTIEIENSSTEKAPDGEFTSANILADVVSSTLDNNEVNQQKLNGDNDANESIAINQDATEELGYHDNTNETSLSIYQKSLEDTNISSHHDLTPAANSRIMTYNYQQSSSISDAFAGFDSIDMAEKESEDEEFGGFEDAAVDKVSTLPTNDVLLNEGKSNSHCAKDEEFCSFNSATLKISTDPVAVLEHPSSDDGNSLPTDSLTLTGRSSRQFSAISGAFASLDNSNVIDRRKEEEDDFGGYEDAALPGIAALVTNDALSNNGKAYPEVSEALGHLNDVDRKGIANDSFPLEGSYHEHDKSLGVNSIVPALHNSEQSDAISDAFVSFHDVVGKQPVVDLEGLEKASDRKMVPGIKDVPSNETVAHSGKNDCSGNFNNIVSGSDVLTICEKKMGMEDCDGSENVPAFGFTSSASNDALPNQVGAPSNIDKDEKFSNIVMKSVVDSAEILDDFSPSGNNSFVTDASTGKVHNDQQSNVINNAFASFNKITLNKNDPGMEDFVGVEDAAGSDVFALVTNDVLSNEVEMHSGNDEQFRNFDHVQLNENSSSKHNQSQQPSDIENSVTNFNSANIEDEERKKDNFGEFEDDTIVGVSELSTSNRLSDKRKVRTRGDSENEFGKFDNDVENDPSHAVLIKDPSSVHDDILTNNSEEYKMDVFGDAFADLNIDADKNKVEDSGVDISETNLAPSAESDNITNYDRVGDLKYMPEKIIAAPVEKSLAVLHNGAANILISEECLTNSNDCKTFDKVHNVQTDQDLLQNNVSKVQHAGINLPNGIDKIGGSATNTVEVFIPSDDDQFDDFGDFSGDIENIESATRNNENNNSAYDSDNFDDFGDFGTFKEETTFDQKVTIRELKHTNYDKSGTFDDSAERKMNEKGSELPALSSKSDINGCFGDNNNVKLIHDAAATDTSDPSIADNMNDLSNFSHASEAINRVVKDSLVKNSLVKDGEHDVAEFGDFTDFSQETNLEESNDSNAAKHSQVTQDITMGNCKFEKPFVVEVRADTTTSCDDCEEDFGDFEAFPEDKLSSADNINSAKCDVSIDMQDATFATTENISQYGEGNHVNNNVNEDEDFGDFGDFEAFPAGNYSSEGSKLDEHMDVQDAATKTNMENSEYNDDEFGEFGDVQCVTDSLDDNNSLEKTSVRPSDGNVAIIDRQEVNSPVEFEKAQKEERIRMEKQEWLTEASSLFHNTFKIHEKIDETNMVTDENTVFCFQSIKSLVPYLFDTLSSSSKYEKYYDLWSQRNLSKLLQNDIEILGSTFPNVIINTEVADCPWSSLLRTTSFTNISVETTSPNVCMKNGIGSCVSTKSESRTTNSDSFLGNAVTDTESSLSSPLNTICTKHATVVKLPPSTKTLPLALEVPVKGRLQSNATNNESDKVSSNMLHDEFNFRGSKPLHVSADGKSIHDSDKTVESKGEIKLAEDASEWLGSQQTSLEHAKPDFTAVEHVTNDSLNEDETQKSMESFVDDTIEESFGDFNNFEKDGPDTENDTIEEEDFGDFEAFTDAQFIDSVQTYDL